MWLGTSLAGYVLTNDYYYDYYSQDYYYETSRSRAVYRPSEGWYI